MRIKDESKTTRSPVAGNPCAYLHVWWGSGRQKQTTLIRSVAPAMSVCVCVQGESYRTSESKLSAELACVAGPSILRNPDLILVSGRGAKTVSAEA
jgi:hypothetical protein